MIQLHQYQRLLKIAKFVLLLAVSLFIFYKIIFAYKIDERYSSFSKEDHVNSFWFLVLALVLVLVNWGLESLKWKFLIQKFEKLSFFLSFKAVLSGVCLSIITPNQIGDFAGRVIHLHVLNKIKGSLVTVIGHTAQVLITCFFGLFALWFLRAQELTFAIPVISVFLILFSTWVYLNLQFIYRKIKHFSWVHKIEKYLIVFESYSRLELFKVLLISCIRYIVFLLQYYLLVRFFDIQISPLQALACISATFCVQSVVPSFFLLELGLRGQSALWFFGMYSHNNQAILLAAYSLWIINMMIPALLGMWFIYKVK